MEEQDIAIDVVVTGIGVTPEAAREDAWRAAVLQATGGYVSAETLSVNNRLVRDEVLAYADGYVDKYVELDQRTMDGLVMIDARVSVRRSTLRDKLGDMSLTLEVDGLSLAAEITSTIQQRSDGGDLLGQALSAFQDVTVVEIVDEPRVSVSGETAKLHYTARLSIDRAKYDAALHNLEEVLSLVATETAQASGARAVGDILGCEHANADQRNQDERGAWTCISVFDAPKKGTWKLSEKKSGREYLIHNDLLEGLEIPYGFHQVQFSITDSQGRLLVGDTLGPCSYSGVKKEVTCTDSREDHFPTAAMSKGRINGLDSMSFMGSILMRGNWALECSPYFEFDFTVESDAETLSKAATSQVEVDFVSFQQLKRRR